MSLRLWGDMDETNGDFFSAKKMSPCYKVHKKIAKFLF